MPFCLTPRGGRPVPGSRSARLWYWGVIVLALVAEGVAVGAPWPAVSHREGPAARWSMPAVVQVAASEPGP